MKAPSYRGFKPYAMDSKSRVSIPSAWRGDLSETWYLLFSKTHGMPMLKVLTQYAYDERITIIDQSSLSEAKKRAKLGSLAMLCREVSITEQGKLLIPKDLCEKAELAPDDEVVLAGREKHFEIWNRAHFESLLAIEMSQEDEDELGVL